MCGYLGCTGHDTYIDSINEADFYIISNMVIRKLECGEKTSSIILVEDAIKKQSMEAESKDMKIINEDTFYEFMRRRKLFEEGKLEMTIY